MVTLTFAATVPAEDFFAGAGVVYVGGSTGCFGA